MGSELIELEKARISFWAYSWDPNGLEEGFVMWKIPSLPQTIEVSLIKYFSSLLILLCFPCVNSSVCGFPPRGHTSLAQHPVNTVPIPPWSFCLCQCLETLRVTLNHLIWTGCTEMCGWAINTYHDCFLCLYFSLRWYRESVPSAAEVDLKCSSDFQQFPWHWHSSWAWQALPSFRRSWYLVWVWGWCLFSPEDQTNTLWDGHS